MASILRSVELERVLKPELERMLLNVQLTHPRGNTGIWGGNNNKWTQVLNQFLVDTGTINCINGSRCICSQYCLDDE